MQTEAMRAPARRPPAEALEALVRAYEQLSPLRMPALLACYAPDACFKDPFNEVQGHAAIERIFRHMFKQVAQPRFKVHTRLLQGEQAMLGWYFSFRSGGRELVVRGVSHLHFDAQGRVCSHRDYWDTAEELYASFALIGPVMRWLARRLSAG